MEVMNLGFIGWCLLNGLGMDEAFFTFLRVLGWWGGFLGLRGFAGLNLYTLLERI